MIDLVKSHQGGSESYAVKRIRCFSDNDREKALNEGKTHSNLPLNDNLLPCYSVNERQLIPSPSNQGAISEVILLLPNCKVSYQFSPKPILLEWNFTIRFRKQKIPRKTVNFTRYQ